MAWNSALHKVLDVKAWVPTQCAMTRPSVCLSPQPNLPLYRPFCSVPWRTKHRAWSLKDLAAHSQAPPVTCGTLSTLLLLAASFFPCLGSGKIPFEEVTERIPVSESCQVSAECEAVSDIGCGWHFLSLFIFIFC